MSKMYVVDRLFKSCVLFGVTLLGCLSLPLGAQTLYVISGTTTNYGPESNPVLLYSVAAGRPHLQQTIVSKQDGLFSILEDLNGAYAILSPHGVPSSVNVLRTEPKLSLTSYEIGEELDGATATRLLIANHVSITSLVVPLGGADAADKPLAMLIPLSRSGDAERVGLSSIDYGQFIFSGVPGGPEGGIPPVGRIINDRLVLQVEGSSQKIVDLPPVLQKNHGGEQVAIAAASPDYVVLSLPKSRSGLQRQGGETFGTVFVKDRLLGRWRDLRLKGNVSRSRLFGNWLASIEESYHPDNISNPGRDNESVDVARLFKYGEGGFASIPGILLLDNLKTEAHVEIRTGQEDSEILNIRGNHICYRINDSIFEADLNKDGIERPRETGRAPEFRTVHWAFWQ